MPSASWTTTAPGQGPRPSGTESHAGREVDAVGMAVDGKTASMPGRSGLGPGFGRGLGPGAASAPASGAAAPGASCAPRPVGTYIFTEMKMSTRGDAEVVALDACALREIDPGRVSAAREGLIGVEDADELAACFRLLGDPKRVRILYALLEAGELCVCDIAATAEVSETTVSHAMRLLRTAGIVRSRRDGRMMYYRLDDAHVRLLLDVSKEHVVHEGSRTR